ncbi:MAG: rRNA maturation RNase YbeY [Bryobacter sp.]|jgi:probable rRNA maturation factor|nr:rRNA maturation RNase YbeY [Bryobacter sp.]
MSEGERSEVLFRHRRPARGRGELRAFAERLRREVMKGRAFTCLVTDDAELRRLNREFRGKNEATDVLSFPGTMELAISWDRAVEQGREHGHAGLVEVQVLMLHGALHLLGHDHETDGGRMRRLEERQRAKLGLPGGLIARGQK